MMLWIVVFAILGFMAGAAFVVYTRNAKRPSTGNGVHQQTPVTQSSTVLPTGKYWGKQFEIPIPENACAAAKELDGKAFALGQAPSLPLTGCDHVGCQCHLVPLVDRRTGEERRAGHERRVDIRFDDPKGERRTKARRKDDDNYNWHYTA